MGRVVAVVGAKGAPGATTSMQALALGWPGQAVAVDADPAGGDVVPGWLAGRVGLDRGLVTLAAATRHLPQHVAGDLAGELPAHLVGVPDRAGLWVLPGLAHAGQAGCLDDGAWGCVELDDIRREILAAEGHLLVQGGPGCGKTTIALRKAAGLLHRLQPEQRVLFLSFSRAAVRQISDRMRDTISRTARDLLEVRTFHAFFLELTRAHGPLLTGHPSSFIPPDRERQLRADFDGDWTQEARRLVREEGRYVFDLLAGSAAMLLTMLSPVRALYSDTYPLIIVDEFQDTNDDQWQAIRALKAVP